jgi:hypothetical protein
MRKMNFLRAVMSVAIAMLLTVGVFAQNPPAPYVQFDANKTVPVNVDYVTVGKTMGYYALPDPVYHPSYVATGALTAGFTWTWGALGGAYQAPTIGVPANNFVQITYPTAGDYRIYVFENSPAAFGGCTSADSTVLAVTAAAAPTAQFTTADILSGLCGPQLAQAINIAITENVPVAHARYSFRVSLVRENINALGVRTALIDSVSVYDYALAGKAIVGTTAGFTGAAPDYDFDFNSPALTVQNNLRTRYTYYLLPAAGVTGNGIVSAISHKSDYLNSPASVTGYAFGAKTSLVYIVNPAPVTGPIYYVPNSYNY